MNPTGYRGPPAFVDLCAAADIHGHHVEVTVEPGRPLGGTGKEYRHLERVRVRDPLAKRVIAEQRIIGDDVDRAASYLVRV